MTRRASFPLFDPNGLAIAIFPEQFPPPIPSNPGYPFVFTRLAGVESDRRVVAERGPYALEERVSPLDVTIVNGVVSDLAQRDSAGKAWVTGPVELLVADTERAPAHVTLELSGPQAASLRLAGRGEIVREDGRALVCVPAPGRSPVRRVGVPLRFEEGTFLPAPNPQDPPTPPTDLLLEAVSVAQGVPLSVRALAPESASCARCEAVRGPPQAAPPRRPRRRP